MVVQMLRRQEILEALHLMWDVFSSEIAPQYAPEGVESFRQFIKYENIDLLADRGELTFFGAWEGSLLCGAGAVNRKGHVALLFVKKERQRQGIGRLLFQEMSRFASRELAAGRITANVAPNAVEAYRSYGMRDAAPMQWENGVCFVPMEMPVSPGAAKVKKLDSRKTLLIAGVSAGCLILLVLLSVMIYREMQASVQWIFGEGRATQEWGSPETVDPEAGDNGGGYGGDTYEDDGETGIDAIPTYMEPGLAYEITEDSYSLSSDDAQTTMTTIYFEVPYPQIKGLEGDVETKVNEILKECAMETVDRLYLNPDEAVKEKVLGEEYPVLASEVSYKITYLSENIMSVAFQDLYCEGSDESFNVALRTRNINLKDGTVYAVKDIVNLDGAFIDDWLEGMRSEAQSGDILSELDEKEMKEVLSGSGQSDVYAENFFLDSEGIEIGLSFNYEEGDPNDLGFGWVTAPFSWEEIENYKTDSDFWGLVL